MKMSNIITCVLIISIGCFAQSETGKGNEALLKGKPGMITYEGKNYKTVKIGKQVWLAENLNYKNSSKYGSNICAGCEDFGRLYTWNSAMAIQPEAKENYAMESRTEGRPISKKHQGICPTGWHIPTVTELKDLLVFVEVQIYRYAGKWQDSNLDYLKNEIEGLFFPYDGGRSRFILGVMNNYGLAFIEPEFWAGDFGEYVNSFGLSIRSSGTGKDRELDKCVPGQIQTDFDTRKSTCCSEGCAGDHFAMWLADENMSCQDKVKRGRHSCEYAPKAALFTFQQFFGDFLLDVDWKYKNSYASVRCLKD